PGEVVIRRGDDSIAGPFALVEREIAEPRVFAGCRVDAAEALAERPDRTLAANLLPAHLLHPDRVKQSALQERVQVFALGMLEKQHEVRDAGVAVVEDRAGR